MIRAGSPVRGFRRHPLWSACALAGVTVMTPMSAQAAGMDAHEGTRRIMLDPALHDLHRRPADEVARIAAELGLEDYLPATTRATRPVTNCNDNGSGSLRGTIASAVSGDVIDLRGLACNTIALTTGQITIPQDSLSLIGLGAARMEIRAGGGKYVNRVFHHTGGGQLIVQGITVSGGTMSGSSDAPNVDGGCISSSGTLALGNALFVGAPEFGAVVTGCRARGNASAQGTARGGGIHARRVVMVNSKVTGCEIESFGTGSFTMDGGGGIAAGSLLMLHSEVSSNIESGSKYGGGGAAILPLSEDTSLVLSSTIVGNTAQYAGGLSIGNVAELRNSTVSDNFAASGGAILVSGLSGEALLSNTTVTANVASADTPGGGILALGQTPLTLVSTIVWGNLRASAVADDIGSNVTRSFAGSHNLVGLATVGMPGDTIVGIDPQLRPLGWYGGRTRTHALGASSQAIGRGTNPSSEPWDQRGSGFPRLVGERVDIGAFEYSDVIFSNGFD